MSQTPRVRAQSQYQENNILPETHEMFLKKRSFRHGAPTRGEPCAKVARNVEEGHTADIPLTPDGLLRCCIRTWKDGKYVDLRWFCKDGAELQPSEKGITLDPVEWEHLADALPDLQAALGSVNVNFQVNLSQIRSATVCCDEEGPYVDVREFIWNLNSNRNFGRGDRQPTDKGIELGKSSLRALSHAATILTSQLPGCAEPPSPPKSARLYRPALEESTGNIINGANHPFAPTGTACDASTLSAGASTVSQSCKPLSGGIPENGSSHPNCSDAVRAVNAMHAAHAAYRMSDPSQCVAGMQAGGTNMHAQGGGEAASHSLLLPQPDMAILQQHLGPPSVPLHTVQGFPGW